MNNLLSFDNVAFANLALCSMVLVFKMALMGFLTGHQRSKKGVYMYPEDVKMFYSGKDKTRQPVHDDPDVERVRRNHLNDLENIPPFILVAFFYVLIQPTAFLAVWHFRIFTLSRILHTVCYQVPIPQPSRALCQIIGLLMIASMATQVTMFALSVIM